VPGLFLHFPKRSQLQPKLRAFIDAARELLRQRASWAHIRLSIECVHYLRGNGLDAIPEAMIDAVRTTGLEERLWTRFFELTATGY
jgi:hypothetical protein